MWQVLGQDHIVRQLEASLRQGRLAHAYLLVGPPHVGKMTLALNLAQALNCASGPGAPCEICAQCARIAAGRHADVRVVGVARNREESARPGTIGDPRPGRSTVIGIDEVKEVLRRTSLKPFEGAHAVVIFDGAESMSEEAANALLKTLEEPPPQVVFLLLTANEETLLPTIRSRCQRLSLRPAPRRQIVETLTTQHGADTQLAERLSRLSRGCLGWALTALSNPNLLEQIGADVNRLRETSEADCEVQFGYASELASIFSRDRESGRRLLHLWLRWWRDLLLIKEGGDDYIHDTAHHTPLRLQASGLSTADIVGFLKRINQTLNALDDNANPRLALEVLMLNLPQQARS